MLSLKELFFIFKFEFGDFFLLQKEFRFRTVEYENETILFLREFFKKRKRVVVSLLIKGLLVHVVFFRGWHASC